ncbi:fungal-specific transcription factor domain-domain-containing protein, partial [Microdochium bolleyi]
DTRARERRQHVPAPRTHLDLLRMPSAQKRLIHHWVTFTSTKLVLIDEPTNPCRALMLPMALRGVTASSDTSTADIATFHAICACAAYNLYNLRDQSSATPAAAGDADHELALAHDQEAIQHLRHNLSQADSHHDQSFAMAIMACITIEAVSGSTRRWRTHVTGGLAYLSRLRARAAGKGADADVFAAFQAHMVSMAILCGCDDISEDLKSFLHGAQRMELTFPYYGASSSFLRHQDRMNSLAGGARGNGMILDEDVSRELDALELQLYLDFPPAPGRGITGIMPPPTHALMLHHMAQAFYYASLVFCQRCVRRAPLASVQGLVESGVRQLEAIEAVSGGEAGSVMMWPALVLAAECGEEQGLQSRMLAWFEAKSKFGFRNVVVLQELVQTLWAMRRGREREGEGTAGDGGNADDAGELRWQEMMCEEKFDVFRL